MHGRTLPNLKTALTQATPLRWKGGRTTKHQVPFLFGGLVVDSKNDLESCGGYTLQVLLDEYQQNLI